MEPSGTSFHLLLSVMHVMVNMDFPLGLGATQGINQALLFCSGAVLRLCFNRAWAVGLASIMCFCCDVFGLEPANYGLNPLQLWSILLNLSHLSYVYLVLCLNDEKLSNTEKLISRMGFCDYLIIMFRSLWKWIWEEFGKIWWCQFKKSWNGGWWAILFCLEFKRPEC